jgi:transposase
MPHVSRAGRGTFNPHPESVSDVLFIANPFFDPRDLLQVRYEMLRRHSLTKPRLSMWLSTSEFHARLSNSQAALRKAGLSGLLPRPRGPREAHKLSEEVAEYVRAVRATAPGLTTVACLKALQEKFGITVHRRSLERAMARRKNRASWRKIIFRKERSKHTREFVGKQSEPMDEKDTRQAAVFLRSRRGILGSVGLDEALGHSNRYIRQSTPRQVPENTESTQRQCALRDRVVALSWPLERIHVVELRSRQVWLTVRRPGWFSETGQRNRARQGEPGDGAGGLTSGAKLGRLASANRLMLAGGRTHSRRRRSLRSVRTSMTGSCSD